MEVIAESFPRARKAHECDLCLRTITPGEIYARQFSVDGRGVWTFKDCRHCRLLDREIDCQRLSYYYGYDYDTVNEWEPETIHDARLKIGWRRKWRHRDGTLYQIRDGRIIV